MRTERDLKNQIAYAEEKGREEGLQQGCDDTLRLMEIQLRERGMSEADIASIVQSVRKATKTTSE